VGEWKVIQSTAAVGPRQFLQQLDDLSIMTVGFHSFQDRKNLAFRELASLHDVFFGLLMLQLDRIS